MYFTIFRPCQQAKHTFGFRGCFSTQRYLLSLGPALLGAALPVVSLHLSQLNKVMLLIIRGLLL